MRPYENEFAKDLPVKWNVLIEDFNGHRILIYNVFNHAGFLDSCKKAFKKYKEVEERDTIIEEIKRSAMYFYWSKCEWEVIVTGWPTPHNADFEEAKIDVYDQLMLNWDSFIQYCFDHAKYFRRRERKSK